MAKDCLKLHDVKVGAGQHVAFNSPLRRLLGYSSRDNSVPG